MLGSMLAEAWSALLANRLRSSLTMLGMIIGVAAVIGGVAGGMTAPGIPATSSEPRWMR